MKDRLERWSYTGLALYIVSYFLPGVTGDGKGSMPGWYCAWISLTFLASPPAEGVVVLFYAAGLVNVLVLLFVLAGLVRKGMRVRIFLAVGILISAAASWIVVLSMNFLPAAGCVLWTVGMLLMVGPEFARRLTPANAVAAATSAATAPLRVAPVPVRTELPDPPRAAAPPVPRSLQVIAGPHSGQRVALHATEFWIGAQPNNHLCLCRDSAVSGNHACLRLEGDVLRLYDNRSLNDTWINGQRVGDGAVVVRVGDRLKIGMSEVDLQS